MIPGLGRSAGERKKLPTPVIWPQELVYGITKRRTGLSNFHFLWGFPDSLVGKEATCNAGEPGLIPGLGRSPGEGIGYPLQYSWASLEAQLVKNPPAMWPTWVRSLGLEDPWRRERLPTPVFWPGEFHGVAKSRTRLNDLHLNLQLGLTS